MARTTSLSTQSIEERVRRQLRVRERLTGRELAARAEVSPKAITRALHDLVAEGFAVRHPGGTKRGSDRAPRYSKASGSR